MVGMEKFTQRSRRVLSLAHQEASSMQHSAIEPEHLFLALIEEEGGVAGRALIELGVDADSARRLITEFRGKGETTEGKQELSPDTRQILEWSGEECQRLGHHYIGTEHLLISLTRLLTSPNKVILKVIVQKLGLTPEQIRRQIRRVLQEGDGTLSQPQQPGQTRQIKTPLLDRLTDDLIVRAEQGEFRNLARLGGALQQVVQILMQRNRNNPLIIGKPGIGKTALVQDLARAILDGDVPLNLLNKQLLALDFFALIAGVSQRSQLAPLVNGLLAEAKDTHAILVLDNLGLLFESPETQKWLYNFFEMVFSELSEGNIQIICIANRDDFEQHIKNRQIFMRVLVPFFMPEPAFDETLKMFKAQRSTFEEYHHLIVTEEALDCAIQLTNHLLPDRQQPEKALAVLDAAATASRFHSPAAKKAIELSEQLRNARSARDAAAAEGRADEIITYGDEIAKVTEKIDMLRTGWERAETPKVTAEDIRNAISQLIEQPQKGSTGSTILTGEAEMENPEEKKMLVFISHASEDKTKARSLCKRLREDGFDPWLDKERILPGQDWDLEIEKALRGSDAILLCFSKVSAAKEGYVQKEYKRAMSYQAEKPEGTIFVIPVRLDDCEMPFFIQELQWVDYPDGYQSLVQALNQRAAGGKKAPAPKKRAEEKMGSKKKKPGRPTINIEGSIHANQVIMGDQTVYHTGRDIIQGDQTNFIAVTRPPQTKDEFMAILQAVRAELATMKQSTLTTSQRQTVESAEKKVVEATEEATKSRPLGERIKTTLSEAKEYMDALGGSLASAMALGTTIGTLLAMVVKLFGL